MSSNSDQGIPNVMSSAPVKKKKNKGSNIFSVIIILAALAFGGYYLATNFLFASVHSIAVENNKITTTTTGQDILDKGLVLCDVNGKVRNVMTTEIKAKEIYNNSFFIGVPDSTGKYAKCSGVEVTFGNFGGSTSTIANCGLYRIQYTPGFQDEGVSVLVDGENMQNASLDQWVDFLKEKSYKFSKSELEQLRSGSSTYESFTQAKKKYAVSLDKKSKNDGNDNIVYDTVFGSIKIERDVTVTIKK